MQPATFTIILENIVAVSVIVLKRYNNIQSLLYI